MADSHHPLRSTIEEAEDQVKVFTSEFVLPAEAARRLNDFPCNSIFYWLHWRHRVGRIDSVSCGHIESNGHYNSKPVPIPNAANIDAGMAYPKARTGR